MFYSEFLAFIVNLLLCLNWAMVIPLKGRFKSHIKFDILVQWNLPNPTLVRTRKMCRIRRVKMHSKTLICVERFCRIQKIPDYTGVGVDRFHCT